MTDIKMKGNLQNAEIIKLEDDESNQVVKKSSVPHFPSFKRVSLHSINNSILDIRSSINAMGNRNDESSNIWSTIQDKLIPAFSGFGYRGPVEDLNNLVKKWIDRSNPEAIDSDLNIMFKTGMVLIANKLINTSNEMLPQKLAEIWSQFFSNIVPNLQGALLPIRNTEKLKFKGSFGLEKLNIRILAFFSFRMYVIYPMRSRLQEMLMSKFTISHGNGADVVAKLTHMLSTLISISKIGGEQYSCIVNMLNTLKSFPHY